MKAFRSVTSRALVLDRPDVDTDQIIPKQFLRRIERTGFGEFLFFDWRKDPGFELNRPEAKGARILLAGRNFGCGSSREHAPWALQEHAGDELTVNLEARKAGGFPFELDDFSRDCLLQSLDDIALTLRDEEAIAAYEAAHPAAISTLTL